MINQQAVTDMCRTLSADKRIISILFNKYKMNLWSMFCDQNRIKLEVNNGKTTEIL